MVATAGQWCPEVIEESKRLVLAQLVIMAIALIAAMVMIAFPLLAVIRLGILVVTSSTPVKYDEDQPK